MNKHPHTTRRSFLATVGGGMVATAFAAEAGGTTRPLDSQLEAVTEATEQYTDPRTALDDGYQPLGPYVQGMGWHFRHSERAERAIEEGVELTRPTWLTYGDTGGGFDGLVLGAVEYSIPVGVDGHTEDEPPDIFDDDGSESWHTHPAAEHAFVMPVESDHGVSDDLPGNLDEVPPEERFRTTNWIELTPGGQSGEPLLEPGTVITTNLGPEEVTNIRAVVDSIVHPDLLTLHVWVHHENPEGVFVPVNPDLPNEPTP